MGRIALSALLVLASGCSKDVPTSVVLTIEGEAAVGELDAISLDIYDDAGVAVSGHALRADGGASLSLPATVVLYPPRPGTLRVRALGSRGGTPRAEGASTVVARAGEQTEATLRLTVGRLPDRDGDGVPDAVDNCPDIVNTAQTPCGASDGGDGGLDGDAGDASVDGPDATVDSSSDTTTDLPPCACPLGCAAGTSTCKRLVPSGGFTASSYQTLSPLTSDVTIDTDACNGLGVSGALQTQRGTKACVFAVRRLTIQANRTVTVNGSLPLVLLVDGDVDIRGLLDVGAKGVVPGPGGFDGGATPVGGPGAPGDGPGGGMVCSCNDATNDECGGGGGSFGGAGAAGGIEDVGCATSSAAGATYGDKSLVPLQGGSGGAGAGQVTANQPAGAGGGGGGALQISAQGVLTLSGAINAGGGGGQPGLGSTTGGAAGGGGGSGGAVLLEAERFAGGGTIAANGGGGGAGGSLAGCTTADPGADGDVSGVASGGAASGTCGAGGDGASGAQPAGVGADAVVHAPAGGGGGGLGRVRVNWYNQPGGLPLSISGQLSTGGVVVSAP